MESLKGAKAYMQAVESLLEAAATSQLEAIDQAATAMTKTIQAGGMIYLFGTGHSHMLAEEGHYRAGGLAPACPILNTGLMLHEDSVASSRFERMVGYGPTVLERYHLQAGDVLVVFSNSGVNAVPVEVAQAAKEIGLTVIAVVSRDYSAHAPLSPLGKRLLEVADIVLDNGLPAGDALVDVADTGLRTGSGSTVIGAFLLNAILTEVVTRLAADGQTPPIYISANMPGASEHNAELFAHYRARNPHL